VWARVSRQVQLTQTVSLAAGQTPTLHGDTGLTATLSRKDRVSNCGRGSVFRPVDGAIPTCRRTSAMGRKRS